MPTFEFQHVPPMAAFVVAAREHNEVRRAIATVLSAGLSMEDIVFACINTVSQTGETNWGAVASAILSLLDNLTWSNVAPMLMYGLSINGETGQQTFVMPLAQAAGIGVDGDLLVDNETWNMYEKQNGSWL